MYAPYRVNVDVEQKILKHGLSETKLEDEKANIQDGLNET